MSADRDVTRVVEWLKEDAHEDADRVFDLVLDQIDTTPQRRASWLARRLPTMNNTMKIALAAAVVVLAAIVWLRVLPIGETNRPGGPTATATATTTPAPTAQVLKPYGRAQPGRYLILGPFSAEGGQAIPAYAVRLAGWPDQVSATLPAGWKGNGPLLGGGIDEYPETRAPQAKLRIWFVLNVTVDGCSASTPWLSPPIGPSVDDLVAGLAAIPGVDVTEPQRARLAGFSGVRMDLTVPAGLPDCESFHLWRSPATTREAGIESWIYSSPQGWLHELWILDVTGHRLVIDASRAPDAPAELVLELNKIVDSIDIKP